ncbi:MAG: hypothetical protein OQK25_03805 [Gammaproteobacteria bacterium]|nr:hypothetical protein [Gammaproteobacteria bacterium]MCW8982478.1 hypothetical protein [Gammaproteobacteria bacterium]
MINKLEFTSYEELLHFLHENQPEQFAVLRQNETVYELAYITEMEDQPTLA